ncbi:hypothetical protein GEMRC1_008019 [Eukaryota sp. GEM-RC1]
MSLRPTRDLFADEDFDEDDYSDRRRTIMDSALGRRGIRTQIPILRNLESNKILSWIDDLAAYAVAKEDLDNEILNTYLFDIPAEEPRPAEEPPVSSLEALLSLHLSPKLREQLEAAHEDLTAVPAEATDVAEETAATSPHHPDDDPSPPNDFQLHISRDVMNSIRLISPSSLNSQPQLWEFFLDLTRVKSLDQAIRLLSTVAMDHKIRDPFARLFDYVAVFTKLRRRLHKLAIPEKQFMLEFLKSSSLKDDFDHLIQSPPKAAVAKTSDSSFDECRIELPSSTEKKLLELLKSKEDAFGPPHPDGIDAPPMSLKYHDESSIVNKPPRKINPARLEIANEILDELTSAGFAEEVPADCPHGKPRLTGDYSGSDGVDAKTINVEANLPRISDIIEFLINGNFIATLDLPRAF